jgi:hypothetical protein
LRLVSIDKSYFDSIGTDAEVLQKQGRPCVLVLRLRFRGKRRDFAVPLRSNISPRTPKDQYFALPPRPTTKPYHRHGIHYLKMFPISKKFYKRFRIDGNSYYEKLDAIISRNIKQIVNGCQTYLDNYEHSGCPRYAPDLDMLIKKLWSIG